jgi:predicted NUDIX family phosphoesterase
VTVSQRDEIERVLVVPTELFRRLGYFQGFKHDVRGYVDELLLPENMSYRPRDQVEKDPSFKQLIPYVVFGHLDGEGRQTVFQYTRGAGMGESRLHNKRSIGIGGHISAIDASKKGTVPNQVPGGQSPFLAGRAAGSPYEEGMRRELDEEVAIDSPYTARCVGLINDDQTEVGSVHLGVVHLFDLERPAVCPREPEIIECGFRPVEAILADMSGFETWSQICMRALFGEQ